MATKTIPFLDLSFQTKTIEPELKQAFQRLLKTTCFINGPEVKAFEDEFSEYLTSAPPLPPETSQLFTIGVANGTDALEIALTALGIQPNDEIITTPFTFAATIEAILRVGATPMFVDISLEDLLISTQKESQDSIQTALSQKTKAILPVHLFGKIAYSTQLLQLQKNGIYLLEDAAQAHGAYTFSNNHPITAGTFGNIAAFSFHPTKNLGAIGDAGAITTPNYHLAKKARLIANHGSEQKYHHQIIGQNSRLDPIQAMTLRIKLKYLGLWNQERRKIASTYKKHLSSCKEIALLRHAPGDVFHHMIIRVLEGSQTRSKLIQHLDEQGIGTNIYYPTILSEQPAYQDKVRSATPLTNAKLATKQVLALPCYPGLTEDDISYICEKIIAFFCSQ